VGRPEDLLGYYLQTFSDISATTFVDEVPGFTPSESGTVLNVLPWHDVEQIDLLLPAARETATALRNLRTGRDVLADVRAAAGEDANLEVLTLSRERLASLEREWSLATSRAIGPSYVVVRSGVTLQAYPILHPADATVAVVAARARDGSVAIPDRAVIARPIDTAPGPSIPRPAFSSRAECSVRTSRQASWRLDRAQSSGWRCAARGRRCVHPSSRRR